MDKNITASGFLTIGLDLGDKHTEACVMDGSGEVLETFRVRTTQVALDRALARFEASRIVLEVGTHSPWVSRRVTAAGHEVIVANPRRVRLIAENDSKNDRFDAELLARLGRVDPSLLSPIVHRGEQAQRDLDVSLFQDIAALCDAGELAEKIGGQLLPIGFALHGDFRAAC